MKNALIMGFGTSGQAAKKLLLQQGWSVFTVDAQHPQADSKAFTAEGRFEMAILSPGIPLTHPDVVAMQKKGIPVIGEAEWGVRFLRSIAVGVTGTNGKTTVTSMIAHVLNQCGKSAVAIGNIGLPISEFVSNGDHDKKIAVIELSSYQLETLETRCLNAGIILNITPDHLDRYGSMENYAKAKLRLKDVLKEGAPFFVDEQTAKKWKVGIAYDEQTSNFEEANAKAALFICRTLGITDDQFLQASKGFIKARHRMERVAFFKGVQWINDSKATNVDAVTQAIKSIPGSIILLAGGKDKGGSYLPWLEVMKGKVRELCLFGEAAHKIAQELDAFGISSCLGIKVDIFETLKEALFYADRITQVGETVLLSPGCSSFDQYTDYKARGDHFVSLVEEIVGGKR